MSNLRKGIFGGEITTTERLCALTDGVYAIVITLLVLDLKIPETLGLSEAQLVTEMVGQVPNFLAYFASFGMAAFLWMRNHWILKPLKECDEMTFWINFVHLMFLSLTPYTASLLGNYPQDPLTVILFSGCLGLASLSLIFLHRHVISKPEWHQEGTTREWTNPIWWRMYPPPFFAMGSILVSFINVQAAVALWLLLPAWAFIVPQLKPPA
jgi:uncharacterized membrane protein